MPEIAIPTPHHADCSLSTRPKPLLRNILRDATAADHAQLDATLGALDLCTVAGYRRFLEINATALLPLERSLERAGVRAMLPDWGDRARTAAILTDLARLGGKPGRLNAPELTDRSAMLGTLYVLEGSRLGAAYLLRTVRQCSDPLVSGNTASSAMARAGISGRNISPFWNVMLTNLPRTISSGGAFRLRSLRARGGAVMNRQVDLTNCDREPIHIPGSIQPFGFLLGLQSDFTICIASENVASYLGRDVRRNVAAPRREVLSKAAVEAIRGRVDYLSGPDAIERIFGVPLQDGGKPFDLAVHFSGVYSDHEAEPSIDGRQFRRDRSPDAGAYPQDARHHRACTGGGAAARVLTGFDRVMVYRFHPMALAR